MKRIMTLIGGILAVVVDTIYAIIMLIGISAIIDILGGAQGSMTFAIISITELVAVIDAIIMNAIAISAFSCNHERYTRRYRYIIQAMIINVALSGFMIYSMTLGFSIFDLLILLGSVAATVLYIVDMCLEKKRVAATTANAQQKQDEKKVDNNSDKPQA